MRSYLGAVDSPETTAQVFSRLYREAQSEPQGLKHFEQLAEEDEKRYAEELKVFKETLQKQFDRDHGLLPISSTPASPSVQSDRSSTDTDS